MHVVKKIMKMKNYDGNDGNDKYEDEMMMH
jgi:hypothetical protein